MKITKTDLRKIIREEISLSKSFKRKSHLAPKGKQSYASKQDALKHFEKVKRWWGDDMDYKITKNSDGSYNIDIWATDEQPT
jgi:hypothetical protein